MSEYYDADVGIEAVDRIYRETDARLRGGEIAEVARTLDAIDVETLSTVELLAHCSITTAARDELGEHRRRFVARVRRRLAVTEPGRVDALLAGLE